MCNRPIYYRLYTPTGSLTLRSERFAELHTVMLETPKAVFDFQLVNLGRVTKVEWTANGGDWITMSKRSMTYAFARVIIDWSRQNNLAAAK